MSNLAPSEIDRLAQAHRGPVKDGDYDWESLPLIIKNKHREAAIALHKRGYRLSADDDQIAADKLDRIKHVHRLWRDADGILKDPDEWLAGEIDRILDSVEA